MASLTVREVRTGRETPIDDVDMGMTNVELIEGLIDGGVLTRLDGNERYIIVDTDNGVSETRKTLQELGYQDGDTVLVVTKDLGAKNKNR
jgi:hypothetical protein